ncbi:cupin domain-containing protein [Providencia rettgeri]|nr:cupin domain-containing protein [Providencia rettgeri]
MLSIAFYYGRAWAYTIVEGQKMMLEANDFVLTPNGTWHEHGVAEDGLPCIWQDGLDIPLVNAMEAGFYKVHPDLHQAQTRPIDYPLVCGRNRITSSRYRLG